MDRPPGSGPGHFQPPTEDPSPMPRWSVVLPVYNQADHVSDIVLSYLGALDAGGPAAREGYELILVPNGCRDNSAGVCAELAAKHPSIRTVPSDSAGWGVAVRTGLAAAVGEMLCYTNLARTTASDLARLIAFADGHPDCVTKADRRIRDSKRRKWGSALYNVEAKVLFGARVRDINGTPKVFPRRFDALLGLRSDGDLLDLEFVALCAANEYPIVAATVTSTVRHSGNSTTGLRSAARMYAGAISLRVEMAHRRG